LKLYNISSKKIPVVIISEILKKNGGFSKNAISKVSTNVT
jgi:hypothetical protein